MDAENCIWLNLYLSAVTDRCVAKFDHYCTWLHNDIGILNRRTFYAYLLSTTTTCIHCALLALRALLLITFHHRLNTQVYLDQNGHPQPITFALLVQVCIQNLRSSNIKKVQIVAHNVVSVFAFFYVHFQL